jgi:hypothetical protein
MSNSSNTPVNPQEWLLYINERYPERNASSQITNLDKVSGFIFNREDHTRPVSTFFMPTVNDVENFIDTLVEGGSKIYIHLLEIVEQPNTSDLPKDVFDKFFGENPDKVELDYKELEDAIAALPRHPAVLLHADVQFETPSETEEVNE